MHKCQNAEPGTYGHECGKPATWTASKTSEITESGTYHATFCNDCRQFGYEAKTFNNWRQLPANIPENVFR